MSEDPSTGNGVIVARPSADRTTGELFPIGPDSPPPVFWCNWDTKAPGGAGLVMKCLGTADKRTDDVLNTDFDVAMLFAMPVVFVDRESGETKDGHRIVFVTPTGETISTSSTVLMQKLRYLLALKGPGPWSPPLKLKLKPVALPNGWRTFDLLLEDLPTPAAKGRK